MTNLPAGVEVPEIWYKGQRVLRSIFAALVVIVPLANGVAAGLIEYLRAQENVVIPPWVFLVLNGVVAITALIIGGVARLMAVPGFNSALTKIGLGSVPKDALVPVRAVDGGTTVAVKVDPHLDSAG